MSIPNQYDSAEVYDQYMSTDMEIRSFCELCKYGAELIRGKDGVYLG